MNTSPAYRPSRLERQAHRHVLLAGRHDDSALRHRAIAARLLDEWRDELHERRRLEQAVGKCCAACGMPLSVHDETLYGAACNIRTAGRELLGETPRALVEAVDRLVTWSARLLRRP